MKKFFIVVIGLMLAFGSEAQNLIRASLQKSATPNSVDVLFTPTYTAGGTEFVNFLQLQVSIPVAVSAGVSATITPLNNFASIGPTGFQAVAPFTESSTNERVFGWVYANPAGSVMAWTAAEFIGARITFSGNPAGSAFVSLIDLSLLGGGDNFNSFFGISTNIVPNDKTDYANMFYAKAGESTTGVYPAAGDQFAITTQLVTLPVGLLSFSGYKDGTRNQLRWTTTTEINNKGFDVERSLDGVNYTSIGFVNSLAPNGNSSVKLDYAFTDNNVTGSRQFYRLRQVDFDNRSKLSNIVLIKSDKPAVITLDGMFPNPASTVVNLMLSSPVKDKVQLVVTDMSGRITMLRQLNVEMGSNTLPVNVSALAGGTYMVKMISSNGEVSTGKLVKQ